MREQIHNINVVAKEKLPSPKALKATLPLSRSARKTVLQTRKTLMSILDGKDDRLVIVVGPCSIHDTNLAIDYAERLKTLAKAVEDKFLILMRVYFEKPRTTTGWKGLINDPNIDDTFQIEQPTTATIVVTVPKNAIVTINGKPTTSVGPTRTFISRNLDPTARYRYNIEVSWIAGSSKFKVAEAIELVAGGTIAKSFSTSYAPIAVKK